MPPPRVAPAYATTNTPSAAAPPMPPASIVQKFAGKHIHKANMQAAGASSDADGDADQAQWFDKAKSQLKSRLNQKLADLIFISVGRNVYYVYLYFSLFANFVNNINNILSHCAEKCALIFFCHPLRFQLTIEQVEAKPRAPSMPSLTAALRCRCCCHCHCQLPLRCQLRRASRVETRRTRD